MADATAYSTIDTFLVVDDGDEGWDVVVPIKSTPDLGGKPNMLQTTTLSDGVHTYLPSVKDMGDGLEFVANYTPEKYEELLGEDYAGVNQKFGVFLGKEPIEGEDDFLGSLGRYTFDGELTVYLNAEDVDAVREMTVVIAVTSEPEFEVPEIPEPEPAP